jgi:hypothetical protein
MRRETASWLTDEILEGGLFRRFGGRTAPGRRPGPNQFPLPPRPISLAPGTSRPGAFHDL